MIAFACPSCGLKLKVQDAFAGRQAKCPTCKQPLVVPVASAGGQFVPPQQIDGSESNLARAGLEGGVTLANDPAGRKPTTVAAPRPHPVAEAITRRAKSTQRYVIEGEIARGGMGAVLRAVDCDIRREVAVKYMLDDRDPKKKARFVEEAQINGQLEHPNIVPVYDLGVDAQKRPFIMMKMVKGRSLKDALDLLRDQPMQADKEYTLGRLLNILVNVCHALAFAHARGVVHRDLKPANIMLGDYGEVYVMDWGLAKVLGTAGADATAPAVVAVDSPSAAARVGTVRDGEADLTQEGAILGTPAYMPPEQAAGQIAAIDARSDVYSLGAILYEMLTLQPPVTKDGGQLNMLMQVVQGDIQPPERRNPQRAQAGLIPRDLAAVAMKALAKEKTQRYQSVEGLRRDVERFQEGRSVSARSDGTGEMLWKFVKRNKGFSAGAAAALLTLMCSAVFLLQAWWETSRAKAVSDQALAEKNARTKQAVPALVVAARQLANGGAFAPALEQTVIVLEYDPENADVRLLRGQILVGQKQFAAAQVELADYLRRKAPDADAQQLLELCGRATSSDATAILAMADVLQRQRAFGMAAPLLEVVQQTVKDRQPLLVLYQKQINAAWPGLGNRLTLTAAGQFQLDFNKCKQVTTLDPLRGIALGRLQLGDCEAIQDLTPLQGMPLTHLSLHGCLRVENLAPLEGMKLEDLNLSYTAIRQVTPLRGMPLTLLRLSHTRVQDLGPLRDMRQLANLNLRSCSMLQDLTPLQGLALTELDLVQCTLVEDLTPIKRLPLTKLLLSYTRVVDLTPVEGMKLEFISFAPRTITRGINVLRAMKSLKFVDVTAVRTFAAEDFWPRYEAGEFR